RREPAGDAQGELPGGPGGDGHHAPEAEQVQQLVGVADRVPPRRLPAPGGFALQGGRGSRYHWQLEFPPGDAGRCRIEVLIILAATGGAAGDHMASLGMNDVKTGQKILVNNEPAVITETDYVKPGKGQAFTRVRYRLIKSGRVQELTMKSTDSLEEADVVDTDMQYLYSDGEYWHFMNPETFEQVQADKAGMGGAEKWLKGEEECVVTLFNGTPIMVTPPNFVELKITETDPGVRGDTSGGGGKPATLETGAVVRVPLFVG